jgi:HlyD family secretion protein
MRQTSNVNRQASRSAVRRQTSNVNRDWLFAIRCSLFALLFLLVGCTRATTPVPTPAASTPTAGLGSLRPGGAVSASARIVPVHEAQLSFTISGRVAEVPVALGQQVQPGQTLVALETASLDAQVAQAQAALEAAQASLARLTAGARPEEVAIAESAVSAAGAQVSQAQAAEQAAQAQCSAAQSGVEGAQAALEAAQARSRQLDAGPAAGPVAAAQAQVKLAEAQLQQAQAAYDRVKDAPDIEMRPEALALQQATTSLDAARAQLAALYQATTPEDKQAAAADVQAARVQVTQSTDQAQAICAQATQASAAVEAAQAQQAEAEGQLALLKAGAAAPEVTVAAAQVDQADAALQLARTAREQAVLKAPFAGTITALEVDPGETVSPGQIVLSVADLSLLRAETTDLSELDVARVAVGQEATVYVEALGQEIAGRVVGIAPEATTVAGDVVFAVSVDLDEQPSALRWGMSADVEITTN